MTEVVNPARGIGRLLRLVTGVYLMYEVWPVFVSGNIEVLIGVGVTMALILAFYLALHLVITRWFSSINKWFGAALAVTPMVLVFIYGGPYGEVAGVAYIGASLVLMAVRGDGGCEVMAFPGLLVGRFTHLVCIAFSPIDWLEEKIAKGVERGKTPSA